MKLKELKPNPKNPRRITPKRLESLSKSLEKYGDLSGFVYNTRSKMMVSGHQKQKLFKDAKIEILGKFDPPTAQRTTSIGWAIIGTERFKYREVDADPEWETGAMLAANKHGGEWDQDLLKVALAELQPIDYEVAGFEMPEIKRLDITMPTTYGEEPEMPESNEESDAAHIRDTPQVEERIPTVSEELNRDASKSAFDAVDENTEPQGRRIIIIIDCSTDDMKKEIKEAIKGQVEGMGGKFF